MTNPWIPALFVKRTDGGEKSGVTAYWLVEWKKVFSIGILRFDIGSRDVYHSHAFNALTWWLKGRVTEVEYPNTPRDFAPSIKPKKTLRSMMHKVIAHVRTYALTLRGPWNDTWEEIRRDRNVTLTHGRVELNND